MLSLFRNDDIAILLKWYHWLSTTHLVQTFKIARRLFNIFLRTLLSLSCMKRFRRSSERCVPVPLKSGPVELLVYGLFVLFRAARSNFLSLKGHQFRNSVVSTRVLFTHISSHHKIYLVALLCNFRSSLPIIVKDGQCFLLSFVQKGQVSSIICTRRFTLNDWIMLLVETYMSWLHSSI